jgi:hypothetical protein
MFDPRTLTWSCHVCGAVRPDDKISVFKSERMLGRIPVKQNVRYCVDRPACVEGAKHVNFLGSTRS